MACRRQGSRYRVVIVTSMSHRAVLANCRRGSRRLGWIVIPVVLIVAACSAPGPGAAGNAAFLHTLPPGAQLPSDAYCASLVSSSPLPEVRSANKPYNSRKGGHVGARFLAEDGPGARKLAKRITGDFTGTTTDILRWAACKWGINQNIVFA